jgi:hypothetical protein
MPPADATSGSHGSTHASDAATLSSAASMLDDLTARVVEVAGHYQGTDREAVAHQLHEVERALRMAGRQLEVAVRSLGR